MRGEWWVNFDGLGAKMLRSSIEKRDYKDEAERFIKFKSLVQGKLSSIDVNQWCLRNGVEIVSEMYKIAPIEVFFLGLKMSGLEHLGEVGEDVISFIEMVGDRIPVSDNEDFAYLFPKDLYDKILLFGVLPD